MTKILEGFIKLAMMTAVFYLAMKHWVGATNLMKTGARSFAGIYVSIVEPATIAKRGKLF